MITDNEILAFINKPSINRISLVGAKLKEVVIEILTDKKRNLCNHK
jgi:predicted RNA-binding protein (virulence factor B family)